jgi:plastocyanin
MAVYFVLGSVLVAWALVLCFGGMARVRSFPDKGRGRVLMALSAGLALATFAVLMTTTDREHPREEAKAEAAEKARTERPAAPPPAGRQKPSAVAVSEKEYSIDLAGGTTLKAGGVTFDVANTGKIQHDLAVEGGGAKETKTPLIDPGKSAKLKADLRPGKYKLYCTVPGHEQLGMKKEVEVR